MISSLNTSISDLQMSYDLIITCLTNKFPIYYNRPLILCRCTEVMKMSLTEFIMASCDGYALQGKLTFTPPMVYSTGAVAMFLCSCVTTIILKTETWLINHSPVTLCYEIQRRANLWKAFLHPIKLAHRLRYCNHDCNTISKVTGKLTNTLLLRVRQKFDNHYFTLSSLSKPEIVTYLRLERHFLTITDNLTKAKC